MNIESARQLKHFAYKLAIFLAIVIALDQACGYLLRVLYFKQDHGSGYNTTYALEKNKAQIIIIGSSRAQHHYNPQILEDSLNKTCYNTGRGGETLFFYDAVLKANLKRYAPQIIILDLLPAELQTRNADYDRLAALLPYYSTHPEIKDVILLKSPYERLKLLSAIYPYNSLLITSITGSIDLHHKGDKEVKDKGFARNYNNIAGDTISKVTFSGSLDTNKINTLRSFIRDCTDRKIRLYIVISPHHVKYINQSASILETKKLADNYHIPVWDYSQDEYFLNNHQLFNDYLHLNVNGAKVFSGIIAKRIKSDIQAN